VASALVVGPNVTEDAIHPLFHCKKIHTTQTTSIPRNQLLSNPVGIIHTLNFVNHIETFKHIYGDIKHKAKEDDNKR